MLFFVVATIVGVAVAFVFFARRRYIAGAKQSSAELIVLQLLCWCPRLRGQSKLLDGQSFVSSRGVDCLGLLLGSAIGDALGAGVEMVSARNMAKVPDLFQDYVNLRTGKFGINYQSGMVTDDTEHTIANALAMCDPGPVTVHKLLRYYKEEYERSRNWLGIGRQGHGSILEYLEAGSEEEAERAIQRVRKRQSEKDRPGNGPVMRAAVLGLIDSESLEEVCCANADVTHPHPEARASSFATALGLQFLAVLRGEREGLLRFVEERLAASKRCNNAAVRELLRTAEKLPGKGLEEARLALCGSSFGLRCEAGASAVVALFLLKHHEDAWELAKQCILLGGDVDSVCSVALSVAGAQGKLCALPLWCCDSVEGVPRLLCAARRLAAAF